MFYSTRSLHYLFLCLFFILFSGLSVLPLHLNSCVHHFDLVFFICLLFQMGCFSFTFCPTPGFISFCLFPLQLVDFSLSRNAYLLSVLKFLCLFYCSVCSVPNEELLESFFRSFVHQINVYTFVRHDLVLTSFFYLLVLMILRSYTLL